MGKKILCHLSSNLVKLCSQRRLLWKNIINSATHFLFFSKLENFAKEISTNKKVIPITKEYFTILVFDLGQDK
jgi:uracil DNA glycosylase